MALWILLLHATDLDRCLLHAHDQENAEKDEECFERPDQAGCKQKSCLTSVPLGVSHRILIIFVYVCFLL